MEIKEGSESDDSSFSIRKVDEKRKVEEGEMEKEKE